MENKTNGTDSVKKWPKSKASELTNEFGCFYEQGRKESNPLRRFWRPMLNRLTTPLCRTDLKYINMIYLLMQEKIYLIFIRF